MEVKHASFARSDQIQSYTGMKIGGITIFGLPESMPIYVDDTVFRQSEIIMGGGNRLSKLRFDPRELQKLPFMEEVVGLARSK